MQAAQDPLSMVGTTIAGKYRVDGLVGEGGAGIVYRGQNVLLGEPVAIKFVRPAESATPLQEHSFLKEAKMLFSLAHPNIVRMYDLGEHTTPKGTVIYLVLEYIDGRSLDAEIRKRAAEQSPFLAADIKRIFSAVVSAASFAHSKNVSHRDLKPSNVMLGSNGTVKILDFGTARLSDQATKHTAHFTPRYAAPEQWDPARGKRGPWTDAYALGLILYEMGTFRTAAQGDDLPTIIRSVLSPERPSFKGKRADLAFLDPVLARALALETTERYPNAEALLQGFLAAFEGSGRVSPAVFAQTAPLSSEIASSGPQGFRGTLAIQPTGQVKKAAVPPGAGMTLPLQGAPIEVRTKSKNRPSVPPGTVSTLFVPELQEPSEIPGTKRAKTLWIAVGVTLFLLASAVGALLLLRR